MFGEVQIQVESSDATARAFNGLAFIAAILLTVIGLATMGFGLWILSADLGYDSGFDRAFRDDQVVLGVSFLIFGLIIFIAAYFWYHRFKWLTHVLKNASLNLQVSTQILQRLDTLQQLPAPDLNQRAPVTDSTSSR